MNTVSPNSKRLKVTQSQIPSNIFNSLITCENLNSSDSLSDPKCTNLLYFEKATFPVELIKNSANAQFFIYENGGNLEFVKVQTSPGADPLVHDLIVLQGLKAAQAALKSEMPKIFLEYRHAQNLIIEKKLDTFILPLVCGTDANTKTNEKSPECLLCPCLVTNAIEKPISVNQILAKIQGNATLFTALLTHLTILLNNLKQWGEKFDFMHNDLHLGNVLCDENNEFIIIDYGRSTMKLQNPYNANVIKRINTNNIVKEIDQFFKKSQSNFVLTPNYKHDRYFNYSLLDIATVSIGLYMHVLKNKISDVYNNLSPLFKIFSKSDGVKNNLYVCIPNIIDRNGDGTLKSISVYRMNKIRNDIAIDSLKSVAEGLLWVSLYITSYILKTNNTLKAQVAGDKLIIPYNNIFGSDTFKNLMFFSGQIYKKPFEIVETTLNKFYRSMSGTGGEKPFGFNSTRKTIKPFLNVNTDAKKSTADLYRDIHKYMVANKSTADLYRDIHEDTEVHILNAASYTQYSWPLEGNILSKELVFKCQQELDNLINKPNEGGSSNCINILGRKRRIKIINRKKYVTYKKELILLSLAKKLTLKEASIQSKQRCSK